MKKRLFILLGALWFFCACTGNDAALNDYNCRLSFSGAEESAAADDGKAVETLRDRVKSVARGGVTLEESAEKGVWNLVFRSKLDWDQVETLLTSAGRFGIWEAYAWNDLPALDEYIMSTAMENMERYESLAWHLSGSNNLISLKGLPGKELQKVNELIESAGQAGLIPEQMVIFESVGSKDKTDVYVLKAAVPGGGAAMDNAAIADAEAITPKSGTKYGEQPSVRISFTESGTESFRALTAANTGHALVFMLDGKVLTTPMVNMEISGGKCDIGGNYTPESAGVLAAILASGPLDRTVALERQNQ